MSNWLEEITKSGVHVRWLSPPERESLLPDKRDKNDGQLLLQRIHEKKCHLRCTCSKNKAVMYPRHKNLYQLVCSPKFGLHSKDCPFYRDVQGYILFDSKRAEQAIKRQQNTFSQGISLFKVFATATESNRKTKAQTSQKKSKIIGKLSSGHKSPSIVNLFRFLIKSSELNKVASGNCYVSSDTSFSRIKQAASTIPFGNSTLSDWIFYGKEGRDHALEALLSASDKEWSKRKSRPHAFVFSISDNLQEKTKNENGKEVKYIQFNNLENGKPGRRSTAYPNSFIKEGRGLATPGPYLIMMVMAKSTPDSKSFTIQQIFAKPIVSEKAFIPIDSNYERKFIKSLVYKVHQYTTPISVIKPLEGKVEENCFLLPDFLIEGPNFKHLIEVMGMLDDNEYALRKDYIIPRMKKAWPTHTIFEIDPNSKQDLTNYKKRWA